MRGVFRPLYKVGSTVVLESSRSNRKLQRNYPKVAPIYGLSVGSCIVIPHGVSDVPLPNVQRRDDGIDIAIIGRSEPERN